MTPTEPNAAAESYPAAEPAPGEPAPPAEAAPIQASAIEISAIAALPPELEPEPAPLPKRGLPRLLLGILFWPRATFAYLRERGGRSWVLPVLLVAALAVAARAAAIPIEKAQADAALAAIQAQLDAQGNTGGNIQVFTASGPGGFAGLPGTGDPAANPALTYGLPVAGVLWDWLFRGGVLLGLAWLLGGRPSAGAMFRMSGWTLIPNAARLAVALAVMLIAHREPLTGLQGFNPVTINAAPVNVGTTVDGDTTSSSSGKGQVITFGGPAPAKGGDVFGFSFLPLLQSSLLSALDIYTLWGLLLMLIGVAVTARLHWLKAIISTAIYWGLSLVLATLPPLLSFLLLTVAQPSGFISR